MKAIEAAEHTFYDLSKEDMEAQCPADLRLIIRKAYDHKKSGYGPGPSMDDVIKHYNDERSYRMFRAQNVDLLANEALDVLIKFNSGAEGFVPWMVPSMVSESDQIWPIGSFNFSATKRTHPKLHALVESHGWTF